MIDLFPVARFSFKIMEVRWFPCAWSICEHFVSLCLARSHVSSRLPFPWSD